MYAVNSVESKTKLHCLASEAFYVCCHRWYEAAIPDIAVCLFCCPKALLHCRKVADDWPRSQASRCRSLQRCRYDGLHLNDDPVPAPRGVVDGGEFATQLPVQTHISLRQVGAGPARLDCSRLWRWFPASNISWNKDSSIKFNVLSSSLNRSYIFISRCSHGFLVASFIEEPHRLVIQWVWVWSWSLYSQHSIL